MGTLERSAPGWRVRHPWPAAIGFALVPLLFVVPASAVSMALRLDATATRLVTLAAVVLSLAAALLVMRRASPGMREFGWRRPECIREALGFAPIVAAVAIVLAIVLIDGPTGAPAAILAGVGLAIAVGFAEEAWYRGIVLQVLRPKGEAAAVVGSALLFSVVHAAGLLGGAELAPILLQLAFALLFGLVSALIAVRTGSLWPGIVWHAAHNAISFASADAVTPAFVTGYVLIGLVLAAYAAWLWSRGAPGREAPGN